MGSKSAVPLTSRIRSQLRAMPRAQANAVAVPPRIHKFGLTGVALGPDPFATATRSGTPLGNKVPSSASGPTPFALAGVGPTPTSGAVGGCVPFAPTTSAQCAGNLDHSTTQRTSVPVDFDYWFRRAALLLSACLVRAFLPKPPLTRCDFSRKPVKQSRVARFHQRCVRRGHSCTQFGRTARVPPPHVGASAFLLV